MTSPWRARAAILSDYEAFVRLFAEIGVPDPIPERPRWEAEMLPHSVFVEHDSAPIAYAFAKRLVDTGYVFNVAVDPAFRGRGAGRALMGAVAAHLRAEGCSRWCLNVKVANTPALRLYERCGMQRVYRSTVLRLPWDRVGALPRESTPMDSRPIDPAEDEALEAAFHIVAGRLAEHRQKSERVLLRLVDPARPAEVKVGLASFNPSFPGAIPFAVARPTLAPALLEALRLHARPGDASLQLVIERDAALADALVAVGSAVLFELFHMDGDIPSPV